ncbi:MAG: LysR family transcriptional regulator [Paracoccaceae bacterium]|jgi:DNA-binding transcriptional LysR family regulator|nr:LysR family transcriptional regulator [Paracoccaceae bacterium]MDG2257953.1 LysR family transcriptional regulator [Paracoccaceae bacterium]
MKVTLKQLEVFRAVVLSGAISNARKSLGLAQPTISQQLAKMEEILGTQLIRRGRAQGIQLTQAGEFWFRTAEDVLGRIDKAQSHHRAVFGDKQLELHFGTTPSLRGHFLEEAAQITLNIGQFSSFEFVWALTSDEVVEMINSHRINCGVVSESSVEKYKASLYMQQLFSDEIVWVVPREIPDEAVAATLNERAPAVEPFEALNRYVDVGPGIPWHDRSENWFRSELPNAVPFFSCMTHQAAVDFVAGGTATCHSPLSLIPNLADQARSRIKFYRLREHVREAVFVMPKHLLSLRPFADFADQLSNYFSENYPTQSALSDFPPLPIQSNQAAE